MKLLTLSFALIGILNLVHASPADSQDYVCSVRRWHYSGFAGYENLAVIDTHSNGPISNISGYLTSRSGHDLDRYLVQLEKSNDGELLVSLFKDLGSDYSQRTVVVDKKKVRWDSPLILASDTELLDGRDFSDDGHGSLSVLCYKIK